MTFLVGDTHTTFADDFSVSNGYPKAVKFTAVASGTITAFEAYLSCNTSFTVELGIYSDAGLLPSNKIGSASGTFAGGAGFAWETVSGDGGYVTDGDDYWLAFVASTSGVAIGLVGGTGLTCTQTDDEVGALPSSWPGASSSIDVEQVGIRAIGDLGAPPVETTSLEFHLTGVHTGDGEAPYYGRISDPQGGEVVIPLNDARTASVTVSAYDPVIEALAGLTQIPYAVMLKAYYRGTLVFWGPVKVRGIDMVAETVRLDAVDMTLRLVNHYLRRGDIFLGTGDLTEANQDQGRAPVSGEGLSLLVTATETDSFPTVGIQDGLDSFTVDPDRFVGVSRGQNVYEVWQAICAALGPDWELDPTEGISQVYATLNTVDHQGSDKSGTVVFHYGTGRQNLEGLQVVEGEEYCNFAHVLDRDQKFELPVVNATALARTGPYIRWEATEFEAANGLTDAQVENVLTAHGEDVIAAYGQPSLALTLTLPVESETSFYYLQDFIVGDTVGVAGKVGFVTLPEFAYRITQVAIRQDGEQTRIGLDVVADRTVGDTVSPEDPEA